MPQYRSLYLGKTQTCINLYLGEASANLAKWLYEQASIELELYKTDLFLQVEDFAYLVRIYATTFESSIKYDEVKHKISTLLNAYDIMKTHGFGEHPTFRRIAQINDGDRVVSKLKVVDGVDSQLFPRTLLYQDVDHMLYNVDEKVAIFVSADQLPAYKDVILTINGWEIVASYVPSTLEKGLRSKLCEIFHGKHLEYPALYKMLCGFKDLYLKKV